MAEGVTFTLPEIPHLLGEENIEEWKATLCTHFKRYGISRYLTTEVPIPATAREQQEWNRSRLKGIIVLQGTLTNQLVRDKLKNLGWNPMEDEDPKVLYDLVLRAILSTSMEGLSSLLLEFCSLDRANYDSLSAFQTRVTYLKSRLETLECALPDRINLTLVVNALKSTYPDWYNSLMYDLEKNELTWKRLMEDMSKGANHELSELALLSMKSTSNSKPPVPRNLTPHAGSTSKKPGNARIVCPSCEYVHPTHFKWCEQCKQHEGRKWSWCRTCGKHHSVNFTKCPLHANSQQAAATPTPTSGKGGKQYQY